MSIVRKSEMKVGPTDQGCCIRIEGAGTMQESQAAQSMAARTLESSSDTVVVIDLSECDYLDSTFIGCLVQLHRGYGTPSRCVVAAPGPKLKKLIGACGLDRILCVVDSAPEVRGQWVVLSAAVTERGELMRHVMECHRALAQLDSPMKNAFAKIADGIERDLGKAAPHSA